jgi:hypothetical protein
MVVDEVVLSELPLTSFAHVVVGPVPLVNSWDESSVAIEATLPE